MYRRVYQDRCIAHLFDVRGVRAVVRAQVANLNESDEKMSKSLSSIDIFYSYQDLTQKQTQMAVI